MGDAGFSVAIIVPQFNLARYTVGYLDSLAKHTPPGPTYVIIDNGSTDGSGKVIEEYLESFKLPYMLIRNKKNLGCAGALNQGIVATDCEYVCLTNNDMLAAAGWLEPLMDCFDNQEPGEKLGLASGTLFEGDLTRFEPEADRVHKKRPIFYRWDKASPMILPRSVFDDIGLFDERFFPATYEDWDLLFRLTLAGYYWGRRTDSLSYHYVSKTQQLVCSKLYGNYQERLRHLFLEKWYGYCKDPEADSRGVPFFGFEFEKEYLKARR